MASFEDAQAFWDQRFAEPGYIFGADPNVFLASQAERFRPGMRVLDVACGEGRNSVWMAQQGCEVSGFDISPLALAKAVRLAETKHVQVGFTQADVRSWPWQTGAFDAIVCIFIQFAAPAERTRLFGGFRSALAPGGLVILQGYTPQQVEFATGGPRDREHMYTRQMLEEAFTGFELLHLREHEATLAEGTKHVGRSALIDLVASRKGG